MNEHRLYCKCIFFLLYLSEKCSLTGAPRVPGAPVGPAGPDSPCEETEERQQHDQWSTEGSPWSTMTWNKEAFFLFLLMRVFKNFLWHSPSRRWDRQDQEDRWDRWDPETEKKKKRCWHFAEIFMCRSWCNTWESSLFSSSSNNNSNKKRTEKRVTHSGTVFARGALRSFFSKVTLERLKQKNN